MDHLIEKRKKNEYIGFFLKNGKMQYFFYLLNPILIELIFSQNIFWRFWVIYPFLLYFLYYFIILMQLV